MPTYKAEIKVPGNDDFKTIAVAVSQEQAIACLEGNLDVLYPNKWERYDKSTYRLKGDPFGKQALLGFDRLLGQITAEPTPEEEIINRLDRVKNKIAACISEIDEILEQLGENL